MNRLIKKIIPEQQRGYSVIEIIAGLAIVGLLSVGITTFTLQSMRAVADSKDRMQAMMQVENAGYWISRDIQMSSNFTLGESAGFPLQMMRKDTDLNEYAVTYTLNEDGIVRSLIKNEEGPVQTVIARDINTAASLTNLSDTSGMLVFNITSTSGGIDVSRTYKIKPRLELDS